jgi:hypothetical protein
VGSTGLPPITAGGSVVGSTSDGAISNFFHALLNKKSGAAGNFRHQIEQAQKVEDLDPEAEKTDAEKCIELENSIGTDVTLSRGVGMTILPQHDLSIHKSQSPERI